MVFGRVVEGMDVVRKVEETGSMTGDTVKCNTIVNCGEFVN